MRSLTRIGLREDDEEVIL